MSVEQLVLSDPFGVLWAFTFAGLMVGMVWRAVGVAVDALERG